MKNRMQDLDFEQNVAFDKVQEYEFTRRAAQRFRQVVSLEDFEDEDALREALTSGLSKNWFTGKYSGELTDQASALGQLLGLDVDSTSG